MLQALTETGETITPALMTKKELVHVRLFKFFFCPECKERVIFRAGQKVIPHFAHRHTSKCLPKGGESSYHMKGKLQLYQWFKQQYTSVYLEKHIPAINQRPDIYLEIAHRTIAIELQCAVVDPQIIRKRNNGYRDAGITPIWLLGANCFKRIGKHKIKINTFTMEVLQKFSSDNGSQIIYYCPDTHGFFKASDLHMTDNTMAVTHLHFYRAIQTTFPQLLERTLLQKKALYMNWLQEKKRFRLKHGKLYGRELKWRQWLYEKRIYLEQLPSIVHLPIASQYMMIVPVWHWQSYFLLDFLHPLQTGDIFGLDEVEHFLKPYKKTGIFPLITTVDNPGLEYLRLLAVLGYIWELEAHSFKKIHRVTFPNHIDEALESDKQILRILFLSQK